MNQKKRLPNIRGDFSGALSAAIISIPLSIGYGMIVYGPLGAGFLPFAALLGIYGCLLGGICASLLGGTEIQITAPKAPLSLILAAFVAPLALSVPVADDASRNILIVGLASLCVLTGGVVQFLFGALRLGNLIKYVPYPVVSGFMNGIALILIYEQTTPLIGAGGHVSPFEVFYNPAVVQPFTFVVGLTTIIVIFFAGRLIKAVPASLISQALKAGLPLFTTYGATEMASQVSTTAPRDSQDRLFTSGKVLRYRDLKIDDGEILVKGKTLFKGYVDGDKMTLPVDDDGWFRTGDLGRLDVDGYLTFLGRKDNMFISGGENISPEEIESRLCMLPQIAEAVVVPVEDREFGFRPVAFIKTPEGEGLDREQLVGDLERHLPRFKIPVAFYEWPEGADKGGIKPGRQYLMQLAEKSKRR